MYLKDYYAAYPTALVLGPDGLAEKFKDEPALKIAGEYKTNGIASADERWGFEDEIESCFCASFLPFPPLFPAKAANRHALFVLTAAHPEN